MAHSRRAFGPTLAIVAAGATIGLAFNLSTVAEAVAAKNFAVKCEAVHGANGALKSSAFPQRQLCACAQTNRDLRHRLSAAGVKCFDTKITNFNQPATSNGTEPGPGPGPDPGPGPGPGPNGRADNGWGNGPDPENPGSFRGQGVARGGHGSAQTQTASKNSNPDQR